MATRRNVASNGHADGNADLPLSAGLSTNIHNPRSADDDVPSLVDTSSARPKSTGFGIMNGGVGTSVDFKVLEARPSDSSKMEAWEKQYYPGESRALSGIARRAFLLGNSGAFGVAITIYLLYTGSLFWRISAFITALSIFHFLEFWITARYNTASAQVSSYLLSSNGYAYTVAHTSATIECLITCLIKTHGFPVDLSPISHYLPSLPGKLLFPSFDTHLNIIIGLILVIGGQFVRSLAMIQAGQSFNHVVQFRKNPTHSLVTSGIYAFSRHPSYFGFFWWGLGTQLLLGNVVCFFGYAAVLWLFFKRRIVNEEKYLVNFFKEDYVKYRERVGVRIPFI